jgi:ABC-type glycerol-3-phosphate transport system substrate-binding protein
MRFWSGFGGHEDEAARACVAGGWIPPSQNVVEQPRFQQHLAQNPMFRTFVELAASPNQLPTPAVPGAQYFQDEVIRAAEDALYRSVSPQQALREATRRIQSHLESERDSSQ